MRIYGKENSDQISQANNIPYLKKKILTEESYFVSVKLPSEDHHPYSNCKKQIYLTVKTITIATILSYVSTNYLMLAKTRRAASITKTY